MQLKLAFYTTRLLFAALPCLVVALPVLAQRPATPSGSPIINTYAGNGTAGYSGDGGPATSAEIGLPADVALNAGGDLYIADPNNDAVRMVRAATGVITTVLAGSQLKGGRPEGVAVDTHGNLFTAWAPNSVLEWNVATGIVSVVAGAGDNAGYGGDGGPATLALLNDPNGVAVDTAGNVYIADVENCVIREVSAATGIINTVAGVHIGEGEAENGECGYGGDGGPATKAYLNAAYSVAVDGAGNFFIGDYGNCVIRKVTTATGIINTVAGRPQDCGFSGDGGPATNAQFDGTFGVVLDPAGNLYIDDAGNQRIRKVMASTGIIYTVAGNGTSGFSGDGGPATSAALSNPNAVAADSAGNFYIADGTNRVRKVTMSSTTATVTVLTSSANPSAVGHAVTFVATVSGGSSPTGTVSFTSNGATISGCSSAALSSDAAQCVTGFAEAGSYLIVAAYSGDSNNGGSTATLAQIVAQAATATTLTSSADPSTVGQPVTFTSSVSGGSSPTGAVSFAANGSTITGCGAVTLAADTAQCITTFSTKGSSSIVATYSGDSNNAGSSGALTQVIGATTPTVTSSLNPSTVGESVTLTATVSPAGPPTPTGTVGFTSLGTPISGCSGVALSSSLTAECTTSTLPVGTDAIVVTYSGDSNYLGSSGTFSQLVNPIPMAVQFVPVTPCRVVDTRDADGPFGGPEIAIGTSRSFAIPAGPCAGIPGTATAYSLNVTVVPPGPLGYVTIWPTGEGQPTVSTLNSLDGRTKANAAIVPAGTSGAVTVYANNTTNVVLDINGYFETGSSSSLKYYPLTPCRVADTRKAAGPLGGPSLVAATERDFPIMSSSCGIPGGAQVYSLNFTVVPPSGEDLGYLTVWPEGQSRPLVSTLNDPTGTIVANAALVLAGTGGGVAVYPSGATDLVIDVNGYFAAAGTSGLQLYTLTPCRVLDTRKTTGAFSDELSVNVASSPCAPPSTAQAYVFNATVVPSGDLGYLTLWPDGETQPVVSTLNAEDGVITSNMAIVPNKDGKADAYASGTTQLVLDISAYFAP